MSAQPLDVRMARLEGAYEQINHRLNGVDQRLDGVERKINTLREHIDQKFLWVIGLVLVSMILPIAEHFTLH